MEPASIRYNNPGAMWGGSALARKWGATKTVGLNDGMGQGNNIAVFPSKVRGAAAQFDLWKTSKNYRNRTLKAAITTWSGGNWVPSYLKFLKDRVPGLTNETIMNDAYMSAPTGVQFCKAQAWHEAGKPYPMSQAEWVEAQKLVHGPNAVKLPNPVKHVATNTATQVAVQAAGFSVGWAIAIGVGLVIAGFVIYKLMQDRKMGELSRQIQMAEIAIAAQKALEASQKPAEAVSSSPAIDVAPTSENEPRVS